MPPGDSPIQVLTISLALSATPGGIAIPIEMGAHGDVVELLGVHYAVGEVSITVNGKWAVALSSNPEHLLNPPPLVNTLLATPSIYGAYAFSYSRQLVGTDHAWSVSIDTAVIPLYGIIRPRRQILIAVSETYLATVLRAEVYYKPTIADQIMEDLINRKFGKYRRT